MIDAEAVEQNAGLLRGLDSIPMTTRADLAEAG
jgi:hypothetical protein